MILQILLSTAVVYWSGLRWQMTAIREADSNLNSSSSFSNLNPDSPLKLVFILEVNDALNGDVPFVLLRKGNANNLSV